MAALIEVQLDQINRSWVANGTAVAGTATATFVVPAGKVGVVTGVMVSASGAPTTAGVVTLNFNAAAVMTQGFAIGDTTLNNWLFGPGGFLDPTVHDTITCTVTTLGAGITGYVSIVGYTTDAPY